MSVERLRRFRINGAVPSTQTEQRERLPLVVRFGVVLLLVAYTLVVLRTAWMSDDAYITLRTVDNFVHGYGLVWNFGERMQSYTHPLWMLLLSAVYAVTREPYFSTLGLSLVMSVAAALVYVFAVARLSFAALFGLLAMFCSRAFVDYSTSGLENPLSHLLVVLFLAVYFAFRGDAYRQFFYLCLLAALLAMSRHDLVLLTLPPLAYTFWQLRSLRALRLALVGFLPIILWSLFSLFYYGFVFPNTAYAKLNTGIPSDQLLLQGAIYFLSALNFDPLLLIVIAAGVLVPFFATENRLRYSLAAAGVALYLLYILRIGGDFMNGRFLTTPFIAAVVLLTRISLPAPRVVGLLAGLVVLIGLSQPFFPLKNNADYDNNRLSNGIADERGYYFARYGLANLDRRAYIIGEELLTTDATPYGAVVAADKTVVAVMYVIGQPGFYSDRGVYIIDHWALSDPLLARLPAIQTRDWRIGHFTRVIPAGYIDTLATGKNQIEDQNLAAYYDKLALITRGPLFSLERLATIAQMNLGLYNHLIDHDRYAFPATLYLSYADVQASDTQPLVLSPQGGAQIDLGAQRDNAQIVIDLDRNSSYELVFRREDKIITSLDIPADTMAPTLLAPQLIDVPANVQRQGYDSLRVIPLDVGPTAPTLGTLRLLDPDDVPPPRLHFADGWSPLQSDRGRTWYNARSPATVLVESPNAQAVILEITAAEVMRVTNAFLPDGGSVQIADDDGPIATVTLRAGEPVTVPLQLRAGNQVLNLRTIGSRAGNVAISEMRLIVGE